MTRLRLLLPLWFVRSQQPFETRPTSCDRQLLFAMIAHALWLDTRARASSPHLARRLVQLGISVPHRHRLGTPASNTVAAQQAVSVLCLRAIFFFVRSTKCLNTDATLYPVTHVVPECSFGGWRCAGLLAAATTCVSPTQRLGERLEITDVRSLDDVGILVDAVQRSGVVVIEGQTLSRAEQMALSQRMGTLNELPPSFEGGVNDPVDDYPPMRRNSNFWARNTSWKGSESYGDYFHQDGNYLPRPHRWLVSMLYCVAAPTRGGETAFVDLRVEPPDDLLDRARSASVVVDVRKVPDFTRAGTEADLGLFDPVLHPVLDSLPFQADEPVLFLGNPFVPFVESPPRNDSSELRDRLFAHVTQHAYVHTWKPGDLILWDNLQTLHKVMPFDNASPDAPLRELYRTQIRLTPSPDHLAQHPLPPDWTPRYLDPDTGDWLWHHRPST